MNIAIWRKIRSTWRDRARYSFWKGVYNVGEAYIYKTPYLFLKCQNTNCGVPIKRRAVMRLTFPHVPRNGGELRIGIRDSCGSRGFLTTINNRIRSAIGDFVSHPAGDNQAPDHCVPSRFSFAAFSPRLILPLSRREK